MKPIPFGHLTTVTQKARLENIKNQYNFKLQDLWSLEENLEYARSKGEEGRHTVLVLLDQISECKSWLRKIDKAREVKEIPRKLIGHQQ